jgi:DNA polymerase III epsilon subunit-like protein
MMGIPVSDKHGNLLAPALHPAVGIHRFLNILGHYQKQGAVFLGHNLEYDYDMLGRTQKRYAGGHVGTDGRLAGGLPTTAAGFDIDRARKRTIDTMWHDVAMTPTITDESDPRYVARAGGRANAGRSLPNCTRAYGIPESNHSAEDDARSSAELFFKQVERNRARQGML